MTDCVVELKGIQKQYQPGAYAVNGVSFSLQRGRILALLGESGCGKTTTLRLIAGLESVSAGDIFINGQHVAGPGLHVPPERRSVGMVFQDFALFPHLNVADNVQFAISRQPAAQRAARVGAMLELTGLGGLERRMPHELSGGQQQRVALARALAPQPGVILMDEPFSNLDAALRERLRDEVRAILRATDSTGIFVSHDQAEAFSMADDVVLMYAGKVLQKGTPHEVYLRPVSRNVASFVGDANYVVGDANGKTVQCVLGNLPLAAPAHGRVDVLLRPERLYVQPNPNGHGVVERISFFGHDQLVHVRIGNSLALNARTFPRLDLQPGSRVQLMVAGPVIAYPARN